MFGSLESLPSLIATETNWRRKLGSQFAAFRLLCLQASAYQVTSVFCPHCGCNHRIILRHDNNGAVGVCQCSPPSCPDMPLKPSDLLTLEVCRVRLGQALCNAFGLDRRHAELPVLNSFQFGSWSSEAVPAILTIQVQRSAFRRAVAELAAHLRQRFLLFSPTAYFYDANCLAILQNHGAGFFPLDSHVVLTERGTLHSKRIPGELFARFTPQPKETDMNDLARVFALVRKLDTEKPLPPPSLLTVFRLYCMEELSMARIAHDCHCDRTNIGRRLKLIRQRIGLDPRELRRLSPHIAKIEDSLRDGRARRIRPGSVIESEEDD